MKAAVEGNETLAAFQGLSTSQLAHRWESDWKRRCSIYDNGKWSWEEKARFVDAIAKLQEQDECGKIRPYTAMRYSVRDIETDTVRDIE